jgi:hypothetical protein
MFLWPGRLTATAALLATVSLVAGAAPDAATAVRLFRVAPGLKADLFAAEPMVQNVVSFTFR